MQGISKWHTSSRTISVDSLVLISDERVPPAKWPLARVTCVHPGEDGRVRVVSVRTATGSIMKRLIVKLCLLPVEAHGEQHSNASCVAEES